MEHHSPTARHFLAIAMLLLAFPAQLLAQVFFGVAQQYTPPATVWLSSDLGKGLEISGTFSVRSGQGYMDLTLTNRSSQSMNGFAMQVNKNRFGLQLSPLSVPADMPSGQSFKTSLLLSYQGTLQNMSPANKLQVAVKNNMGIFYFDLLIPPHVLFAADGKVDRNTLLDTWKNLPASTEVQSSIPVHGHSSDSIQQQLELHNVYTVARRTVDTRDELYMSLKFTNGALVLAELKVTPGASSAQLSLKSSDLAMIPLVQDAFGYLLQR